MARNRTTPQNGLHWIHVDNILPAVHQPRTIFKEEPLQELADSIAVHGVLQPLVVLPEGDHFRLIAGERRLRASKQAGLQKSALYFNPKIPGRSSQTIFD